MNERQRDLFLWVWSRRRRVGRIGAAVRGAAIGAVGGLVFTLIMAPQAGDFLRMLAMASPAFGFIGLVGADRVFVSQENMYLSLLDAGARVPEQKPVIKLADRGPALAVAIAALLIGSFIIVLMVMTSTGAL